MKSFDITAPCPNYLKTNNWVLSDESDLSEVFLPQPSMGTQWERVVGQRLGLSDWLVCNH